MRRFEFVEGTSSKFWQVERKGSTVVVQFGRIGTSGQVQEKSHPSEAAAESAMDKLIREKTGKGYEEVGGGDDGGDDEAPTTKGDKPAAKAKEAAKAAPKAEPKAPAQKRDAKSLVDAGKGYGLAIEGGKLVAFKDGKPLAAVPKPVKEGDAAERLLAAIEMLEAHARQCVETVESWMLRSLATPRAVLEAVWRDEAWRAALEHAVVVPVDGKGKAADVVGLLRGVDPKKGLGVVDLDGETKWIDAPRVMIPHPVLLPELDDLRGLASELDVRQGIAQLFREVFTKKGRTFEKGQSAIDEFENGKFEMLQQAFNAAKKLGYRVSGGAAIVRVWEQGRVVEARYFLGDYDPMDETTTGDLGWVDDRQKTLEIDAVPAIAFSEGMRMAAAIFAKREVEKKEDEDA